MILKLNKLAFFSHNLQTIPKYATSAKYILTHEIFLNIERKTFFCGLYDVK